MKNFLLRFWQYQKERFPLSVILPTTLGVVGSTAAVSHNYSWIFLVAYIITLIYLLQLRCFDEIKDYEHDSRHYPERPVQRGLVSKKEIRIMAIVLIILEILLNVLFNSFQATVWYFGVLGYSFLTKNEFFIRTWLRQHFMLYNSLHYVQLGIFQMYLYSTFVLPYSKLLVWHLAVVLFLALLLELARKMRSKELDFANDTYSSQLGKNLSSGVFLFIIASVIFFIWKILVILNAPINLLFLPFGIFIFAVTCTYNYVSHQDKKSSNLVQLTGVVYYFFAHFTIILGIFI